MKKNFQWITGIVALALIMALTFGMGVLAEDAQVGDTPTEQADQTQSTQLQDAIDAYCAAKQQTRVSDIEAELATMVEAGQITQEQADLILTYVNERTALQNGTCPNCGYEFQSGIGMGGRNGSRGGKGQKGGGFGFRAN